ncbi:hypothetical protein QUB75_29075 [Microcoleus sp. K1-B6]|uniref:hypothetical protein n=1 Tax=unclassified Microcoleus TaxID=2642155 RepID=UPI002FD529AE
MAEVINNGRKFGNGLCNGCNGCRGEGRRQKAEGRRQKAEGKNRTGTILAVAVI